MLSAVAARKARLAQPQTEASPAKPPEPAPAPAVPEPKTKPTPTKPNPSSQKPPSKRKTTTPAGNPPKRKKSQSHKPAYQQQGRYFVQQDAFKTQDDVIRVDQTDSESSAGSSSSSGDELYPPTIARFSGAKTRGKRAWSPSAPLADSSDEEGKDPDEQIPLDQPFLASQAGNATDEPKILSTFQPVWNKNVFHLPAQHGASQKRTLLLLGASEAVTLLGVYSVTVLQGSVSLAGVTLAPSTIAHPVFAPRSSPLPIIQCLPRRKSSSSPPTSVDLPPQVAALAPNFDSIVMLQELHTGIEGLGRICRTFDGFFSPSRWHRNQPRFNLGLDNVYLLPLQTPDVSPLMVPPQWAAAVATVIPTSGGENDKRPVYLVKGPKNSGKSTFARLLLNRLLSRYRRVAYLECDLGQSEFTPGGMVSLNIVEQPIFGPPFSHPSIPLAAHYVGATSPRTSPSHYLDSIYALMQQYEIDVQNATLDEDPGDDDEDDGHGRIGSSIPLVVNTMGWTKGMGADLARRVEEIIAPSTIFGFTNPAVEDETTYAAGPVAPPHGAGCSPVHFLESIPPALASSHYTAADHRNLNFLSYFHAVFPHDLSPSPYPSPSATSWHTTLPLCAQSPYDVDWQEAFEKVILTGAGMEDVVPSEVHRTLNGAVVALVSCEPGTLDLEPPTESDTPLLPYEQGAALPLPNASKCLGLALVRSISPSTQTRLQLLTPVPSHLLGAARVLVMGELQLPVWGMLDFRTLDDGGEIAGYERGKVPYLRWGKGEGAGGERRRVRRNLMRKGQM
ncbi:hypothetical protein C8Q78DRAFT_987253 [Trametes maxima]|nr:hypothetical protein C8Q78DRAFT_987253 [Trametes maxima]